MKVSRTCIQRIRFKKRWCSATKNSFPEFSRPPSLNKSAIYADVLTGRGTPSGPLWKPGGRTDPSRPCVRRTCRLTYKTCSVRTWEPCWPYFPPTESVGPASDQPHSDPDHLADDFGFPRVAIDFRTTGRQWMGNEYELPVLAAAPAAAESLANLDKIKRTLILVVPACV